MLYVCFSPYPPPFEKVDDLSKYYELIDGPLQEICFASLLSSPTLVGRFAQCWIARKAVFHIKMWCCCRSKNNVNFHDETLAHKLHQPCWVTLETVAGPTTLQQLFVQFIANSRLQQ